MAILLSEELKPNVILSLVQNKIKSSEFESEKREKIEKAVMVISDEFISIVHYILSEKITTQEKQDQSDLAEKIGDFQQAFMSLFLEMAKYNYQVVFTIIWTSILEKLEDELDGSPYSINGDRIKGLRNLIITLSKKPIVK